LYLQLQLPSIDDQRLAAIIWEACWRLVSVTFAPDNMRAISWVRARSSVREI